MPSRAKSESRIQAFLWWLPVIIWAGVIFYMSTKTFGAPFSNHLLRDILALLHIEVSHHAFHVLAFGLRKLGHFTEYSNFAIFLYYAIADDHRSVWNTRKALTCIVLAGLYSLTDEFHQRFVPGRGPSIVDCGFDTIGATIGMVIVFFVGERPARNIEKAKGPSSGDHSAPS